MLSMYVCYVCVCVCVSPCVVCVRVCVWVCVCTCVCGLCISEYAYVCSLLKVTEPSCWCP